MISEKVSILKLLNDNSKLSQRAIGKEIGISLGKVNNMLRKLEDENFIIINSDGKFVEYNLTKCGFEFLNESIKDYKDIKINIHLENDDTEVKQAVILAAGAKSDFDVPVSFLELEEINVLDRMIQILKENGIEEIIIVTGYKREMYEEFAKNFKNITCINNDKYKWTGSMMSLSLAKEYIKSNFILLENDLIFESIAIERIIKSKNRDAVLITNESGSGDEAFVEIRDNYIYKMSKDIHQFNRIDGEMIGVSKISKKLYDLMIKEYSNSLNPYMNYEYTMLDVARNYNLGYEKLDLVWGEIDDLKQYKQIIKNVFPRIRRKEAKYKVEKVKEILVKGLDINESSISRIDPIGGMTNKNYSAIVDGKSYVIRVPGTGTCDMIDRFSEGINSKLVAKANIDAQILYYDDRTGTKISAMIDGAQTINSAMAAKPSVMEEISTVLRNLHNSDIQMKNEFNVFENIELYEELMENVGGKYYEGYYEVRKDVLTIKDILRENGACLVPSHNDTVPENFIKGSDGKLYLIDWEYGGLNDPMWDLAAHIIECGFSEDQEELFLNKYFMGEPAQSDKIRILAYKITQDFLWSIWTRVKEAQGDDFGTYGEDRFSRCIELLTKLKEIINKECYV